MLMASQPMWVRPQACTHAGSGGISPNGSSSTTGSDADGGIGSVTAAETTAVAAATTGNIALLRYGGSCS